MIQNPPNLKDKNLMGRLIDIQEIEKEKIEDYLKILVIIQKKLENIIII